MDKKPMYYWTYEKCKESAMKYKTKKDFEKYDNKAYKAMYRKGYLDICSHMEIKNDKKRCIYVYEFDDNYAYVGLTHNHIDRKNRHKKDKYSYVYKHFMICSGYTFKLLTDYINVDDAIIQESEYVERYKNNGWLILNKSKTGSIGSTILFWNYDNCKKEALKYNTRSEYYRKSGGSYNSALKNGWLNDICSHMIELKKPNGYWDYNTCKVEALKHNTKNEFKRYNKTAYNTACRNKWINKICSHMILFRKSRQF
jgi:hypothetical protein